jgi:PP-loop superfamily ATP-utilizing enzyme
MIQALAGVAMLGVAVLLVFAIRSYMAAASERRMTSMLKRVGIDPVIAATRDHTEIIKEIRRRCHSCSTEDVCERWLSGEEKGPNDFCPNAEVFVTLRQTAARL